MSTSSTEILQGRPRRSGLLLVCVLAGCVLLLSAQAPGAAKGHRSLLQSWILSASAPVSQLVSAVSRGFWGLVDRTAETFTARDENTRLKRDLARSNQELFQLRARIAEEDRLKLLLSAGAALPAVRMAAPVLLIETRAGGQSALIGAGSSSGVVPGSPIAVPEGLVGRLVTVGATVSRAQLLLDASAAAGARIVKTGELGVIRGDGRGGLRLNNVATTSRVAPGDEIESAGIDGIYPRGVPIGRVASVERGSMFLEIRVVPAAPFSRLTDVLVLEPSPALSGPGGGQGSGGP
jgi:rod shape-determining protein MreC